MTITIANRGHMRSSLVYHPFHINKELEDEIRNAPLKKKPVPTVSEENETTQWEELAVEPLSLGMHHVPLGNSLLRDSLQQNLNHIGRIPISYLVHTKYPGRLNGKIQVVRYKAAKVSLSDADFDYMLYLLAGLLGNTVESAKEQWTAHSPLYIIWQKVYSIRRSELDQSLKKREEKGGSNPLDFVRRYSSISHYNQDFLSRLYYLVRFDEGFFVLAFLFILIGDSGMDTSVEEVDQQVSPVEDVKLKQQIEDMKKNFEAAIAESENSRKNSKQTKTALPPTKSQAKQKKDDTNTESAEFSQMMQGLKSDIETIKNSHEPVSKTVNATVNKNSFENNLKGIFSKNKGKKAAASAVTKAKATPTPPRSATSASDSLSSSSISNSVQSSAATSSTELRTTSEETFDSSISESVSNDSPNEAVQQPLEEKDPSNSQSNSQADTSPITESISEFRDKLNSTIRKGLGKSVRELEAIPKSKKGTGESENKEVQEEEEEEEAMELFSSHPMINRSVSSVTSKSRTNTSHDSSAEENSADVQTANSTFFLDDSEYAQYVYDVLDEDEDFLDLVDKLADLFPTYRRTELKIRVKIAEDIDVLVEDLFLEQETNELREAVLMEEQALFEAENQPTYSPAVYQLKDIFPSHDKDTLQSVLDEAKGDLEAATNNLLTGNISTFEPVQFSGAPVSSTYSSTANSWSSLQENATKLSKLTDIAIIDATGYLHGNQGKFIDSLIEVINTHKKVSEPTPTVSAIPRGGRVQRGGSRVQRNTKDSTGAWGTKTTQAYSYNRLSPDAAELKSLYYSNPQFKVIDFRFCVRALEFFEGDAFRVIDICRIIMENNGANLANKKNDKKITPVIKNISAGITMAPRNQSLLSTQFANYRNKSIAINEPERQTQEERLKVFFSTGELDLHRLKLTTALSLTQKALTIWWQRELSSREADGKMDRFGSRAEFVGIARVITGRGLHSVGGIPVIKRGVKEYLVRNRYVYDESVGSYQVQGKRRL